MLSSKGYSQLETTKSWSVKLLLYVVHPARRDWPCATVYTKLLLSRGAAVATGVRGVEPVVFSPATRRLCPQTGTLVLVVGDPPPPCWIWNQLLNTSINPKEISSLIAPSVTLQLETVLRAGESALTFAQLVLNRAAELFLVFRPRLTSNTGRCDEDRQCITFLWLPTG